MIDELKAVATAASSIKTIADLAKAVFDVKGAVKIDSKVFELQRIILAAQEQIFAAQAAQAALIERVRELEKEIAGLKAWETEKERYELTTVRAGVHTYALKEAMSGGEPVHEICATCYGNGRKSILQTAHWNIGRCQVRICHECGSVIFVAGVQRPEHAPLMALARRTH